MRPIHLSASAIRAFLHCPNCFRYAYIEGVRPIADTESQRVGTNWHKLQELYREYQGSAEAEQSYNATIEHLNAVYAHVPDGINSLDWEIEYQTLANSFAGYVWYYQNDTIQTLATEVGFKLPILHPKTGLPLRRDEVIVPGKIDRFVRLADGRVCISDYKSTTKSIDPDSDFWGHLRLDTQLSVYCLSALDLQQAGELEQYQITKEDEIAGAWYDVWHRPQISPKMLTQADTAAFIEGKKYFEKEFVVEVKQAEGAAPNVTVDDRPAEVEQGKKGFAIRETPAMFGARLLADIYERPHFYFVRKEVPRTPDDLRKFRRELFGIYQSVKMMRDGDFWYRNDLQDSMRAHGDYAQLCYFNVDVSNGQTPPGFRRIFEEQETPA